MIPSLLVDGRGECPDGCSLELPGDRWSESLDRDWAHLCGRGDRLRNVATDTVTSATEGGSAPHLERVIGVGGLGASAVNCIVGSGIFGLPGIAAAMLGPAAVLAYLLCAVLVSLVGLCLAEAGSRVSHPGGLYAYATAAFGPVVGGIAGTLLWLANSVVTSAAVANLLVDTLAMGVPALGVSGWRFVALVMLYAVFAGVNIRGARGGTRLSMILAVVKIAPLVLLVIVGAFTVRMSNLEWVAVPAASQVGQAAVLLFFAFIGVEGALNASGEVANPARTVPRAIFLALTLVAALYIGLQVVAQGVLGAGLADAPAPLVAAATAVFGPWGARLFWVTTVLSVTGFLSADVLCSPRNLAALAERRQLPRGLAAVHPRFKTPAIAVGMYALMCAMVAVSGSFRYLVILGTSGTLVLYLIGCLGLLRLRAHGVATAGSPFRAPGGSFVPLAASAIILWLLSTLAWAELAAALSLVAASGVVYAMQERWRRKSVGSIDLRTAPAVRGLE
jgi:APA family basic amino acid/polyamine antiporter